MVEKTLTFSSNCQFNFPKLTHAMNGSRFIQSLPTDVAEPSLVVRRLWPTMRDGILGQTRRNTRAWRDDIGDTFLMDNKVANCQNIQLTQNVIEFVTKIAVHRSEESFLLLSYSLPFQCVDLFFRRYDVNKSSMHFSVWHAQKRQVTFYTHKFSSVLFLLQLNVEHECCKRTFLSFYP
jgi:hypothetical protein